jgi:hypothetical protein
MGCLPVTEAELWHASPRVSTRIVLEDDSQRRLRHYGFRVRTPPLAAVLVFVALLTALTMRRGAVRSDARPAHETPSQQWEAHHHPTSPFERVPAW